MMVSVVSGPLSVGTSGSSKVHPMPMGPRTTDNEQQTTSNAHGQRATE